MPEQTEPTIPTEYRILALYRFVPLVPSPNAIDENTNKSHEEVAPTPPERHPTLKNLQSELYEVLRPLQVRGTLLLAPEGINGTICYPYISQGRKIDVVNGDNVSSEVSGEDDPVFNYLKGHALFGGDFLRTRLSVWKDFYNKEEFDDINNRDLDEAEKKIHELKQPQQAFQRLKIKIKAEIVTMGLGRPLFSNGKCQEEESNKLNDLSNQPSPTTNPSSTTRHIQNQKCNPLLTKGQYLTPSEWDDAIHNPDILVIDTRNTYEIDIGTFDGAIDPKTKHFAEFPDYLKRLAGEFDWSEYSTEASASKHVENDHSLNGMKKPPKAIAMYCTGGIRCEKATSYALQSNLFPKDMPIYHLEGGILAYLDHVSKERDGDDMIAEEGATGKWPKSTFHGECFVFDKRVAVTEGLRPSKNYIPCYGCRGPMDRRLLLSKNEHNSVKEDEGATAEQPSIPSKYQTIMQGIPNLPELKYDMSTKSWYLPGLTCPRCHDETTRESLERFAQRKEQMEICAKEGKSHFHDGKADETS